MPAAFVQSDWLIATMLVAASGAAMLRGRVPLAGWVAQSCSLAAAALAMWRASPWLVPLLMLVVLGGLAVLAASVAGSAWRSGTNPLFGGFRRFAIGVLGTAVRGSTGVVDVCDAIIAAKPASGGRRRTFPLGAIGRGLLLALPVAGLVATLLASGDAVLAAWIPSIEGFRIPWAGGLAFTVGVLVVAGLRAGAGSADRREAGTLSVRPGDEGVHDGGRERRGASVEALVVLMALVVVLGTAVAAQLGAALGGDAYVRSRTGLTYAEYARRGFFQLLAASAVTLVVVLSCRRAGRTTRRLSAVVICSLIVCALSIVQVVSSVRRIALYVDVHGWTMLRLCSAVFAVWLAAVFAMTAVAVTQRSRREWLTAAVVLSATLGLFGFAIAGPEQFVARSHVRRVIVAGRLLDTDYLAHHLSSDAVPELLGAVPRLGEQGIGLRFSLCSAPTKDSTGWSWHWAQSRATAARKAACPAG